MKTMANEQGRFINLKLIAVIFLVISAFVFLDILGDFQESGITIHIIIEGLIGVISAVAFAGLMASLFSTKEKLKISNQDLVRVKEDSKRWKGGANKFIQGLTVSIEEQFKCWNLSVAECEVSFLLLKGLSMKEIAKIRSTSEKTVRAQALSVYSKSGLGGRAELSAFFLEDLLSPSEESSA